MHRDWISGRCHKSPIFTYVAKQILKTRLPRTSYEQKTCRREIYIRLGEVLRPCLRAFDVATFVGGEINGRLREGSIYRRHRANIGPPTCRISMLTDDLIIDLIHNISLTRGLILVSNGRANGSKVTSFTYDANLGKNAILNTITLT